MNSHTHTHMQQLVKRASPAATGTFGERTSYYSKDGSSDPPPSPTAKWKGDVHAHEDPPKDPSRYPYLPHPFPLKRRGRTHPDHGGHPGGFKSLQEPLQPVKFPDEDQVYMSYAEWYWAQRPKVPPPDDKEATFSTSYWPYGRRISAVSTMDKEDQSYNLDTRILKNHTFYKHKRDPLSSTGFSKSRSSADVLLGSQTEHFGYDRSFGKKQPSHASAAFHTQRKSAPTAVKDPSKRSVWDSVQPSGFGGAAQRATSTPNTSRSLEVQAGTSRYEPSSSMRNLGLATRTHAEWCLPQPPPYPGS